MIRREFFEIPANLIDASKKTADFQMSRLLVVVLAIDYLILS